MVEKSKTNRFIYKIYAPTIHIQFIIASKASWSNQIDNQIETNVPVFVRSTIGSTLDLYLELTPSILDLRLWLVVCLPGRNEGRCRCLLDFVYYRFDIIWKSFDILYFFFDRFDQLNSIGSTNTLDSSFCIYDTMNSNFSFIIITSSSTFGSRKIFKRFLQSLMGGFNGNDGMWRISRYSKIKCCFKNRFGFGGNFRVSPLR